MFVSQGLICGALVGGAVKGTLGYVLRSEPDEHVGNIVGGMVTGAITAIAIAVFGSFSTTAIVTGLVIGFTASVMCAKDTDKSPLGRPTVEDTMAWIVFSTFVASLFFT